MAIAAITQSHLQQDVEAATALALLVQRAPTVERQHLAPPLSRTQAGWQRGVMWRDHIPPAGKAGLQRINCSQSRLVGIVVCSCLGWQWQQQQAWRMHG